MGILNEPTQREGSTQWGLITGTNPMGRGLINGNTQRDLFNGNTQWEGSNNTTTHRVIREDT